MTGPIQKFQAVICGKQEIVGFHDLFVAAINNFLEHNERPCDLQVPENFKLYYDLMRVEALFFYLGWKIRIKQSFNDKIKLTSYDTDRTIELTMEEQKNGTKKTHGDTLR